MGYLFFRLDLVFRRRINESKIEKTKREVKTHVER